MPLSCTSALPLGSAWKGWVTKLATLPSRAAAQRFLGGGVGVAMPLRLALGVLEELIGGRDDVFDLGLVVRQLRAPRRIGTLHDAQTPLRRPVCGIWRCGRHVNQTCRRFHVSST
jgi:hypothetical protein